MKLFEALGGWVATVPELDVKMRLGTHCYKHAWHAELWHKRLPELREMNPDRLTKPANDAMVRFVEAMTEPEAAELTHREARRRLPGVHPPLHRRLHVPPQQHEPDHRRADDPLDQLHPAGRVRRLARRRDDAAVADRDRPEEVERAAAHQARLEKLMVEAGGIAGPGSIGSSAGEAEQVA